MKIITYNTQQGRTVDLFNSLKNLFEMNADFYTFQEVDLKVRNIINDALDTEKYSVISGNHKAYPGKESKTMIVYSNSYKLVELFQIPFFSKISVNSHGTTLGIFEEKSSGNKIQISSTHQIAPHLPYIRRKQTLESLGLFDDKIPGILAGDFNTSFPLEVKKLKDFLFLKGIIHITSEVGGTCEWERLEKRPLTFIPRLIAKISSHSLPLDHICINNEFSLKYSLKEVKVLKSIKGSDHLPIFVEFIKL